MFESTPVSPLYSPAHSLAQLPDSRTLSRSRTLSLDLPTKADPSVYLTVRSGKHAATGAFSPTPDATASLRFFAHSRRRPAIPTAATTTTTPQQPLRALSIPSISRTASSAASVSSPMSPAAASLLDFDRDYPRPKTSDGTPPALASLERRSRLCATRVFCATCRTPGTNFPACARCGSAWCSRACRLPNGARHVCAPSALSRTGISTPPVPAPRQPPVPSPTPMPSRRV